MVVGIVGASGLIGSELANAFIELGVQVVRISRTKREVVDQEWRVLDQRCLEGLDVVINLAGEPIGQRWSEGNREKFYESRVGVTQCLHRWILALPLHKRPSVWLNTSAVGIYGDRGGEELDELSSLGEGYLAELCADWENAANAEPISGCKVLKPRIGIVLDSDADAWLKMKRPFLYGVGGKLGTGKQWFPWVHLQDVVGALVFLSLSSHPEGVYNIVAPEPVTNTYFTKALGRALSRPAVCAVPAFVLGLILGDFSQALLASQRVIPNKLEALGFKWEYRTLEAALIELCDH
ncbi:MAG: TIGR01777 family oxidoreductase [Rubritalea sp.]